MRAETLSFCGISLCEWDDLCIVIIITELMFLETFQLQLHKRDVMSWLGVQRQLNIYKNRIFVKTCCEQSDYPHSSRHSTNTVHLQLIDKCSFINRLKV